MKCNNCGKDVYGISTKCPYCYSDLAFYNNGKSIINKHGTFFHTGGLFFLIFVFPFLCLFCGMGLIGLNLLGKVVISNLILNLIFYSAIIMLILNGFFTLKNNVETDQADPGNNLYKPKKKGIALGWTLVSIMLLFYPTIFKVVLKEVVNLEGVDYSKAEYIEIKDVKIPSLYSSVGEKTVDFNLGIKDDYDATYGFTYDGISITYIGVSEEEVYLYKSNLIDNGYVEIAVENEYGEIIPSYVKNHSNATFSIVCIIDMEFTYGVADGRYEDYFN